MMMVVPCMRIVVLHDTTVALCLWMGDWPMTMADRRVWMVAPLEGMGAGERGMEEMAVRGERTRAARLRMEEMAVRGERTRAGLLPMRGREPTGDLGFPIMMGTALRMRPITVLLFTTRTKPTWIMT